MLSKVPVFEHDHEPVPGLPARLPDGEYIAWQGRPTGRLIARRVFKTHWVAGYFLVLVAWALAAGFYDGRPLGEILFSAAVLLLLGGIAIAMLELFAWGVQKTTLYTITNHRLVMRIGVALSVTLNLPFRQIASADMSRDRDGSGDIVFRLNDGQRFSWLILWPHVRPWRMTRPEPSLRCIPDVEAVAKVLQAQLAEAAEGRTVAPTVHVSGPEAVAPEAPVMAAE